MSTALEQVAGRLVDAETGEIVCEPEADLVETLETYAKAHAELTLAELDYKAREAEVLKLLDDPELQDARARMESAAATVGMIAESLGALRPTDDPLQSVSLDTGHVRVTWGKARETWSYAVKAKDLAARDPGLAKRLGVQRRVGAVPKPRITVRAQ